MKTITIQNEDELKKALGIVLDLAQQNALDEDDISIKNYEPLHEEAKTQGKSIEVVDNFIRFLNE